MKDPKRILVFQTAFLGDVILTLPMIQKLHEHYPHAAIDVVTTPKASEFLHHHPAVTEIISYDKRKTQRGLRGMIAMSIFLKHRNYDLAVVPHRSIRSSLIIAFSRIPVRIGFSSASGKIFYTHIAQYLKSRHEIERNLELLTPLGIAQGKKVLPGLYPSAAEKQFVNKFLFEQEIIQQQSLVAIAPGSVWNTKRWPLDRYARLSLMLAENGFDVIIIGGKEDSALGRAIVDSTKHKKIFDATGKLSLLQSAELIRRCRVLITNDSAPLHIGVAVKTRVVAIFGATVPEFGFAPYGDHDVVVETKGLSCRPCAIHGGDVCPVKTFVCMNSIEPETVFEKAVKTA